MKTFGGSAVQLVIPILRVQAMTNDYAPNATGRFYHGTRADLAPGDLLTPGNRSNYADRKLSWITFSGTLGAAL